MEKDKNKNNNGKIIVQSTGNRQEQIEKWPL